MKLIALAILASLFSAAFLQTAPAQKLVDPDKVAPEFREAASKRRSEQIKIVIKRPKRPKCCQEIEPAMSSIA
jgi:hypothetical protein